MHPAAVEMHSSLRSGSRTARAIQDREWKYGPQRSRLIEDHPPSASLPRSGVSSSNASAAARKESTDTAESVSPSTASRQPSRTGDVKADGYRVQISRAAR